MTKSKGVGRGGVRQGAGRVPRVAKVDWNAVGLAYFTGAESVEVICGKFDIQYSDLLAYANANHWIRGPVKRHPEDLGDLASALALTMYGLQPLKERYQRFVRAMAALNAHIPDIADALQISVEELQQDFAKELASASR